MPNGHGGYIRFGSPALLLIVLVLAYFQQQRDEWHWIAYVGYVLVAIFGWRLAVHLHMWQAIEFGGGYTSGGKLTYEGIKVLIGTIAYSAIGVLVWYVLIW